jgi:hypothetical protein
LSAPQTFNAAHRTFPHKPEHVEPLTTVWWHGISGAALNAAPTVLTKNLRLGLSLSKRVKIQSIPLPSWGAFSWGKGYSVARY